MKKSLILAIALTLTSNVYAYTLNGVAETGARWKSFPINMKLNPTNAGISDAEVQRVITSAMNKWNTGTGKDILDISAVDYSVTAATGMDKDGVNSITFSANFREDSNGFDPDVTVAVGGQYGDGDTMTDAFIVFNSESVAWATDKETSPNRLIYHDDLETIALHELGHVIGLGHTTVAGAAMNPSRTTKTLRTLSTDDTDGASYLIGSGATGAGNGGSESASASKTAGCGSISNSSTNNSNIGGLTAMMLLPLAVLVFARRKASVTANK